MNRRVWKGGDSLCGRVQWVVERVVVSSVNIQYPPSFAFPRVKSERNERVTNGVISGYTKLHHLVEILIKSKVKKYAHCLLLHHPITLHQFFLPT